MAIVVGKDQFWVKRCTCRKCASIVEYVDNEVLKAYDSDYTGSKDLYYFLYCPSCTSKIRVK